RADLGSVSIRRVIDEHVDAAHALAAGVDSAGVVIGARHVGVDPVRAGLLRHSCEQILVPPREHDGVARGPRQFDGGGADALAAAGDQKASFLHSRPPYDRAPTRRADPFAWSILGQAFTSRHFRGALGLTRARLLSTLCPM